MRIASWVVVALLLVTVSSPARTYQFEENRGQAGIEVSMMTDSYVDLSLRLDQLSIDDVDVDGNILQQISVPGVSLPGNEGAPNLPGFGRFIAVPNGAIPRLEIVSMRSRSFENIDVLPSHDIPLESDDSPLEYVKDPAIYSVNALYPEDPVALSDMMNLRGVSAVVLGITPFQYNPVTRMLTAYTEVSVRVHFDGGNGTFGEDRLRNYYWEPILAANLVNYASLPAPQLRAPNTRDDDYEYVIICPDDPTYTAWADSIAQFRIAQGIDAGVVTLTETGATYTEIESWIDNAYAGPTPPVAILLLADFVSNGGTTGITSPYYGGGYCVSDNIYGDVDGDQLPDIVMARMTANPSNIETLVRKAIDYERNPPTNPDFYMNPVMACGWQTERWFQLCTEIVYGYLANIQGMTPVREYAIYSGTPGGAWSSNPNTYMLLDYFGPDGLGYVPLDSSHLTDWGGNASRLNADINSGAFIVQHRDHGSVTGWGEPDYGISDLSGLHNDDLTFVFSINCLTGMYDGGTECFAEAFHRMNDGALGLIAASETSYSFVNDTFIFGLYDEMWPDFMPDYPAAPGPFNQPVGELRPAFGNASGKHFLYGSNWPYNPDDKEVTYHLFHMHGDAFTRIYSKMPQTLTVTHQGVVPIGATTFNVTADEGAIVALTVDGEIIGVAEGTGAPMDMTITPATAPGVAKLTVTKSNFFRHVEEVPVIYPVTYTIVPPTIPVSAATSCTVTVWDSEGYPKPDVEITISGWGVPPVMGTTDGTGATVITVNPNYGEDLSVVGRTIGEPYDCLDDVLPVTGGTDFASADVDASVASIGLYGSLTPYYEGLIEGLASNAGFYLKVDGCGVADEAFSGAGMTASLTVTPTSTGTINTAICKKGFNVYLEDIAVDVVYGQLAGSVFDTTGVPIVGAVIKGYPAGSDTTGADPIFEAVSEAFGAYAVEGDLDVGYYDVYVSKFGYLTASPEIFVQYSANVEDFYLDSAPSGVVSGTVTETGTGNPLEATVKFYRSDNMEIYTETTSDPSTGSYSATLPYFNYTMNVRAYHHIPENRGISVSTPAMTEDFVLDETLANILLISDGSEGDEQFKVDENGTIIEVYSGNSDESESATQIETDLIEIGYDVTVETVSTTDPGTWLSNYDFIISSSGDNTSPVEDGTYRTALEDYVAAGGKLLLEGGEVAYDAASYPGYPTFASDVCHTTDWNHDSSGNLTVYDDTHPLTTFPNVIGNITFSYSNYGDQDAAVPLSDADMVCSWTDYPSDASVIVYDDTPNPLSGQIVFFMFDYLAGEPSAMMALLENAVTYLVTPEAPPEGGITGTVTLAGETNHSGATVTLTPGGESVVTDTTGYYAFTGLYPGTYTVNATKADFAPDVVEDIVVSGSVLTGVDMTLFPLIIAEYCSAPGVDIPNADPAGMYDYVTFTEDVEISDIEIYMNITHTAIGELYVELTSPEGTTVRLHNGTGTFADDIIGWYDSELTVDGPGSLDDFTGESTQGEWTLWVADNVGASYYGSLNEWCVYVIGGVQTGVEDELGTPLTYELRGVSPNPFNPVTNVSYGTPSDSRVKLAIYNVAGRLVRTLVDREVEAGNHVAVWDGRDDSGVEVGSGVYFCRMEAEGFEDTAKMVLLK
jgi:subtilisin-like proprotein convertase family protein